VTQRASASCSTQPSTFRHAVGTSTRRSKQKAAACQPVCNRLSNLQVIAARGDGVIQRARDGGVQLCAAASCHLDLQVLLAGEAVLDLVAAWHKKYGEQAVWDGQQAGQHASQALSLVRPTGACLNNIAPTKTRAVVCRTRSSAHPLPSSTMLGWTAMFWVVKLAPPPALPPAWIARRKERVRPWR
jgi:hypothetical protein